MAVNINHEGYDRRLAAVDKILGDLNLKAETVTPIAYVDYAPFYFNNYLYKVDLAAPATPSSFPSRQPGTMSPPTSGISTLVFRFSNARAEGLNNANRIENVVAAMSLARAAIAAAGLNPIVPAVYAWAPCRFDESAPKETDFGWTLDEFMPGEDLDGQFPGLSLAEKRDVVGQMADVFTAVQKAVLPVDMKTFGALTFSDEGAIVTGEFPLLKGGPWERYADVWVGRLRMQLADSEKSPALEGWKVNGVRERLEAFLEGGGVDKCLEGVDVDKKVLVHGDLTMNNMLFDKDTKRITALLDFDWAAVTLACEEFFTGFTDVGGSTHKSALLQGPVLSGDFARMPEDLSDEDKEKWDIAKCWHDALEARAAVQPSSIPRIRKLEDLRLMEEILCPFMLSNEVMLKRVSKETRDKTRRENEEKIVRILEANGF